MERFLKLASRVIHLHLLLHYNRFRSQSQVLNRKVSPRMWTINPGACLTIHRMPNWSRLMMSRQFLSKVVSNLVSLLQRQLGRVWNGSHRPLLPTLISSRHQGVSMPQRFLFFLPCLYLLRQSLQLNYMLKSILKLTRILIKRTITHLKVKRKSLKKKIPLAVQMQKLRQHQMTTNCSNLMPSKASNILNLPKISPSSRRLTWPLIFQ